MKVAKDDRDGQIAQVGPVATKQPHELDDLGKRHHVHNLRRDSRDASTVLPPLRSTPAGPDQQGINDKGERGESRNVQRIRAPGLLRPDVALAHERGPVGAPVGAGPARALKEELVAVLERRLDLALVVVLDPRAPLVTDEPARDKVVVVGVEDPGAPLLVAEPVQEIVARQDLGAVGPRAPGHAARPAVHVVRGRDLKVATLNVRGAQPVPHARREGGILTQTAHALVGAHAADGGVFKGSEDPGHQGVRPGHVVVGHDGDGRAHLGERLADLETLVGNGRAQDADQGGRRGLIGVGG